jgi:hypothetical protein
MAPEEPSPEKRPASARARESWSDLSRAGKWVVATVLAAAIGAPVGALSTQLLTPDDGPENSKTSTEEESKVFDDYFSTSGEKRWKDDADTEGTGGQYTEGAYQLSAERAVGRWGVLAWPSTVAENVRITAKVDRVDGTADDGYGYGLFCRADGQDNLYAFTIWKNHAVIEKRVGGRIVSNLGTDADVTAEAEGDIDKELQAVCTTSSGGNGVDLEFWVDGERVIGPRTDPNPLASGNFGLFVALGQDKGNIGDTFQVQFDDFVVRGTASTPSR